MPTKLSPSNLDETQNFSALVPSVFQAANAAFLQANAAFLQANTGGGGGTSSAAAAGYSLIFGG